MAYYSYFVYTNYIGTVWEDVTTVYLSLVCIVVMGLLVTNHTDKVSIYCFYLSVFFFDFAMNTAF